MSDLVINPSSSSGGSGDVVGPSSSTDNAIVRFNGTTGKLVQNSAATIDDTTGNITAGTYNGNTIGSGATSGTNTGDQTISLTGDVTGSGTGSIATTIAPLDGTPNSDHSANGPKTSTFNAGESVTVMDLVYLKSDGEWWKTDADAEATAGGLLAISLETKSDGQAMSVALPGSFVRDDTWNWTVGATLYIDTATAGGITATQPSGTDDVIRVVGFAVTADVIYFNPSPDYITHV